MRQFDPISEPLLRFVHNTRLEQIPHHVRQYTKLRLINSLTTMILGTHADGMDALRNCVESWGGKEQSTLSGVGKKVPMHKAALVNTTAMRALELDDVHEKAMVHPSVATVPLAFAVGEALRLGGAEVLTAIITGQEVICRLGLGPSYYVSGAQHKPRGWSFTCQAGILGGSLAAGRLLGCDLEGLRDSLGISYSNLSGNQQAINEGTLAVRLQQGLAAETGVQSALLAAAGISGPKAPLSGKFGWLKTWHDGEYSRDRMLRNLGTVWECSRTSIKPYAVCKISHTTVAAIISAMRSADISLDQIKELRVHVSSRESWESVVEPIEQRRFPMSPTAAQFSLTYASAIAARFGRVDAEHLSADALDDPLTLEIIERIRPLLDEAEATEERYLPMPGKVEILTFDGRAVRGVCKWAPGHPAVPLQHPEVVDAFWRACNVAGWISTSKADDIIRAVTGFEHLEDVGIIPRMLG